MDISHHIAFRIDDHQDFAECLKKNNIALDDSSYISSFDILQSDPRWNEVKIFVEMRKLFCLAKSVFSKEELQQSQWLSMRSTWHVGYPQPEAGFKYETITYTRENHCRECGCGLKQVAPFRMKKQPKFSTRHFMMLNWVADELFLDEAAKNILQEASVSGVSFWEVHNKGASVILPDIYQLMVNTTLKEGLVTELSPIRATLICEKCGRTRYHPHGVGKYTYRKEIFENAPDVVKTAEMYGWGHSCSRDILIRQSVYRLLSQTKIDRGLEFSPVELI